jgi:hypothetical protein
MSADLVNLLNNSVNLREIETKHGENNPVVQMIGTELRTEAEHEKRKQKERPKLHLPSSIPFDIRNKMISIAGEYLLVFDKKDNNPHAIAAAFRKIYRRQMYDLKIEESLEIGANPIDIINSGDTFRKYNVGDMQDKDEERLLKAVRFAKQQVEFLNLKYGETDEVLENNAYVNRVYNLAKDFISVAAGNEGEYFEIGDAEFTKGQAKNLLFIHSLYDISLEKLVNIFATTNAVSAQVDIFLCPQLEFLNEYEDPITGMIFKRCGDLVHCFFKKDSSPSYTHNFQHMMALSKLIILGMGSKNYLRFSDVKTSGCLYNINITRFYSAKTPDLKQMKRITLNLSGYSLIKKFNFTDPKQSLLMKSYLDLSQFYMCPAQKIGKISDYVSRNIKKDSDFNRNDFKTFCHSLRNEVKVGPTVVEPAWNVNSDELSEIADVVYYYTLYREMKASNVNGRIIKEMKRAVTKKVGGFWRLVNELSCMETFCWCYDPAGFTRTGLAEYSAQWLKTNIHFEDLVTYLPDFRDVGADEQFEIVFPGTFRAIKGVKNFNNADLYHVIYEFSKDQYLKYQNLSDEVYEDKLIYNIITTEVVNEEREIVMAGEEEIENGFDINVAFDIVKKIMNPFIENKKKNKEINGEAISNLNNSFCANLQKKIDEIGDPLCLCEKKLVYGGPGTGKTYDLIENNLKENDMVVCQTKEDKEKMQKKIKSKGFKNVTVCTFVAAIANPVNRQIEQIHFDECYLNNFAFYECIFYYYDSDRAFFYGDHKQNRFCDFGRVLQEHEIKYTSTFDEVKELRENRRLRRKVIEFLNEKFGYNMICMRTDEEVDLPAFAIKKYAIGDYERKGKWHSMTNGTINKVLKINGFKQPPFTSHTIQGQSYKEDTNIAVEERDVDLWIEKDSYLIVSLSRSEAVTNIFVKAEDQRILTRLNQLFDLDMTGFPLEYKLLGSD